MKSVNNYEAYEKEFPEVLNKHSILNKDALLKQRMSPYMTKSLRKTMMKRSQIENKRLRNTMVENVNKYLKKKNYCSNLSKNEHKELHLNVDIKSITYNKLHGKL